MIETVFALLLIIDHEIKEHRIQVSLSDCLKGKRVAERQLKENTKVSYKCIKSKAETEIYLGQKSIKKLILE
ncbi:hypothetical protein [uncultured Mediterranean phage uvMED]|jgi:hypothetical protein|nr:MAG: hypothetical protein CBD88_05930 [Flavobacteriales bacterium TMED228]BAQ87727.1 hypothetical protein [uncultured Mediterranean phage uvMED]BAQ87766.1 hypothetical protein [uncultured Mediterranean phage uvMED]|tara:strand:+ start:225 stop:440 length:216 start_codon:yes stop_codon:yes gene_type:complete